MMKFFVYGTLKKGYWNHYILENSKFVGTFLTAPKYDLYLSDNIPFITDGLYQIRGEVYDVNEKVIKNIDWLEDHPNLYIKLNVMLYNREKVTAYFGNRIVNSHSRPIPDKDWVKEYE